MSKEEDQLIQEIAEFTHDPLGFSKYAFPWGEVGSELESYQGPRQWQSELFNDLGNHLQNPETRHQKSSQLLFIFQIPSIILINIAMRPQK